MTDNNAPNTNRKNEPEYVEYSSEDEIDLIELFKPLWQQKILIAGITFLTIVIAVVLVLQATPQYKISAQLKPGIYRWDSKNNPIPYLQSSDLQSILTGGSFLDYIAKSGFAGKKPALIATASKNRRSNQVTAYFFWPDRQEGKQLLSGFIDSINYPKNIINKKKLPDLHTQPPSTGKSIKATHKKVKTQQTKKQKEFKLVDFQVNKLKREIALVSADLTLAKKEAALLDEKISVTAETQTGYEKSRREIDENTKKIISLRDKLLASPPDDNLQLLLLASTIQQNISYLNMIEQKIADARQEIIANRKDKGELLRKQENYRLQIADLKDKINNISLINVVKSPRASFRPLKPKKKKIVALAGIVGLFMAIIIAYFRHFIKTAKLKTE